MKQRQAEKEGGGREAEQPEPQEERRIVELVGDDRASRAAIEAIADQLGSAESGGTPGGLVADQPTIARANGGDRWGRLPEWPGFGAAPSSGRGASARGRAMPTDRDRGVKQVRDEAQGDGGSRSGGSRVDRPRTTGPRGRGGEGARVGPPDRPGTRGPSGPAGEGTSGREAAARQGSGARSRGKGRVVATRESARRGRQGGKQTVERPVVATRESTRQGGGVGSRESSA